MVDGVIEHVTHVLVSQAILGFPAAAGRSDQAHLSQMPQVLGHERLAGPRGISEFVHAPWPGDEGAEDAQAHGIGEGLEEVRRSLKLLILSHIRILADLYEWVTRYPTRRPRANQPPVARTMKAPRARKTMVGPGGTSR